MLKSELIEKIAEQNPHLYERDVEAIIKAILDTITTALPPHISMVRMSRR